MLAHMYVVHDIGRTEILKRQNSVARSKRTKRTAVTGAHYKLLHAPKVTIWSAMSARGIIGMYVFEDAEHFLICELQNFTGYNQRI